MDSEDVANGVLRERSPRAVRMSQRLIIDSLIHLIDVYGIDGFRFDLAELLDSRFERNRSRAQEINPTSF